VTVSLTHYLIFQPSPGSDRERRPCLARRYPRQNVFLCVCIEDKMVGLCIMQHKKPYPVALDMPSHRRKAAIATWSSNPRSLRKKTRCCPGLQTTWAFLQRRHLWGLFISGQSCSTTARLSLLFINLFPFYFMIQWSHQVILGILHKFSFPTRELNQGPPDCETSG